MSSILRLESLYRNYGYRKALMPLDLDFGEGQTICILGPNGAGKSSFFEALLSPLPDGARLHFRGESIHSDDARRRFFGSLGFVGHDPGLYLDLTCAENLRCFYSHYSKEPLSDKRLNEDLEWAGLGHRKDDPARALSRGMKQRLGLIRSLLHDPDLWLLDEPITGLDLGGQELLIDMLKRRNQSGLLSIAITHTDEPFLGVASRYLYLRNGQLVADIESAHYSETARKKVREILRKG